MKAPTDTELLAHIDAFLDRTGMPPSRFGIEATGEGGLVKSIRDGRSLSLRNVQRVLTFMQNFVAPVHTATDTPQPAPLSGGNGGDVADSLSPVRADVTPLHEGRAGAATQSRTGAATFFDDLSRAGVA